MPKKSVNYLESARSFISNTQNMVGGNIDQDKIIIAVIVLISIYIFTKTPVHLVGFLAHPFTMTGLVLASVYYFKENNIPMSGALALLLVITIVTKKESDIQNIMPILNREHFTSSNEDSNEEEDEEEEDETDDEESDDEEEETEDKESFDEPFVGKKYSSKNLNDTFKNLHDAIHQLENFISTSEA